MTIYAVPQSEVGLAVETTRGTAIAPTGWAKVKSPTYKPDQMLLEDDTLQGSMVNVYDAVTGLRYDSHGWSTYAYLDTLPYYILGEFGSGDTLTTAPANTTLAAQASYGTGGTVTISTAASIPAGSFIVIDSGALTEGHYTTAVSGAGPYSVTLQYPLSFSHANGATVTGLTGHQWSLLNNSGSGNQPKSLTITDYDGEEWRQMAAAQIDKLSLKITPDKQVDVSVTFFANAATTPSAPTVSFTTEQMPPGWSTYVSIGGGLPLTYVESIDLDFSRGVKPVPAFTGTQAYYSYFAGPLVSSGKITVIEQSGAPELTKYLNGTVSSLDVSFFDRKSGHGARFHSTNTMFKTGELVRGKEYLQATLDILPLPSATDATAGGVSPFNVQIGNAQTTTYN